MDIPALSAMSGDSFYVSLSAMQKANASVPQNVSASQNSSVPGMQGVVVEISQEAKNYAQKLEEIQKTEGCQTCKNRRYVDESSDSTVSYQSPTKIAPGEAASKVMAHEQEHVTNETLKAEQSDRKVIIASVSLQTSICPECGKPYVSGGTTRVLTASDSKTDKTEDSTSNENSGESSI